MPRLRVLSMRNNHLKVLKEKTFRNLRGNIAVLDLEGNPIECSCELRWLSVWLYEINFPGPKCKNGRLLRSFRMQKRLCLGYQENIQRAGNGSHIYDDGKSNKQPLFNEHGDLFQRKFQHELGDDCSYEMASGERPLAGESEYFYDHYVDFSPGNNTLSLTASKPLMSDASSINKNGYNQMSSDQSVNLNTTALNTKYFYRRPSRVPPSPFTFFGYPIPIFSLGPFFDKAQRKETELEGRTAMNRMETPAKYAQQRGKVRLYQPSNAMLQKYLTKQDLKNPTPTSMSTKMKTFDFTESSNDVAARNRISLNLDARHTPYNTVLAKGVFRTSFKEPTHVEHGGFKPIESEVSLGGFKPVLDLKNSKIGSILPFKTLPTDTVTPQHVLNLSENIENNFLPLRVTPKDAQSTTPMPIPSEKEIITVAQSSTGSSQKRLPFTMEDPISGDTIPLALTTMMTHKPTTYSQTIGTEKVYRPPSETDIYSDLQTQSVSVTNPPPHPTTIPETILLIPPLEEHEAQIILQSNLKALLTKKKKEAISTQPTLLELTRQPGSSSNVLSGRSTVSKVFTQETLQLFPNTKKFTDESDKFELSRNKPQAIDKSNMKLGGETVNRRNRKDGMEWYYDSFKGQDQDISFGHYKDVDQRVAGDTEGIGYSRHSAASFKLSHIYLHLLLIFHLLLSMQLLA